MVERVVGVGVGVGVGAAETETETDEEEEEEEDDDDDGIDSLITTDDRPERSDIKAMRAVRSGEGVDSLTILFKEK